MTLVLLALILAFTVATAVVLADSGLRLWSAFGGLKAERAALRSGTVALPGMRVERPARMTTRVSYARATPLRAAA